MPLQDWPTISESGLPGFVSDGWAGLPGPSGLPVAVVTQLYSTLTKAVEDPATNDALKKVGAEPVLKPQPEFSALIAKDWKVYGEAIRIANVKVE
jgi:tripartite-type tricarboxylate transporter receptor subunit TctC